MAPQLVNGKTKLILALDVADLSEARMLVKKLRDAVGFFKVGHQLFTRYGPEAVRMIQDEGGEIFLDLKYHDIPNTVALAAEAAVSLGIRMFNVHASGGRAMLTAAAAAAEAAAKKRGVSPPILLGVTVLTSLLEPDLAEIGVSGPLSEEVERLAWLAHQSGLNGVVASAWEIPLIRKALPRDFLIVTPGVRPGGVTGDDQKRVLSPRAAVEAGADYIVVGRPILQAPDPGAAANAIVADLAVA